MIFFNWGLNYDNINGGSLRILRKPKKEVLTLATNANMLGSIWTVYYVATR